MITDEEIVKQAADAASAITMGGLHDSLSSTATYFSYSSFDADGHSPFGASIIWMNGE